MPLKVTPDNQQRAASLVKTMLHAPQKKYPSENRRIQWVSKYWKPNFQGNIKKHFL